MTCNEMIPACGQSRHLSPRICRDMMYQAGVTPSATDLPVFLRDVAQRGLALNGFQTSAGAWFMSVGTHGSRSCLPVFARRPFKAFLIAAPRI